MDSLGLTRRQAMVAAAAVTLRPRSLLAGPADREPIEFAVVSDTHLGRRDRDTAEKAWERTAVELAASDAKFVLHLGDVVDGGRAEQYERYVAIRDRIGKPVHEIPGNHDPLDAFRERLRKEVDTAIDHGWLRCLLVNNAHRDSHDGFLEKSQIEWIDAQCREAARTKRLVLVAMHVPVHANKHPDRGWYVKPEHGQTAFYEVLRKHASRVVAVFHGHFHNGIRGWNDHANVHEVTLPSALYNQDRRLEQQGAAGFNLAEFRPGYTLVSVGRELTLRYKPIGAEVGAQKRLELRRRA